MESHNQEKLRIRPLGAKLERDLGLTSMDPFCIIRIGNQEKVSHVCEKGGVIPRWEERFEFDPNTQEENILISLWDKRTLTGDQEIGIANVPLSRILSNKIFDEWVDIFYKDQKAGSVWLIIDKDMGTSGEEILNKPKSLGKEGHHEEVLHQKPQELHKPASPGRERQEVLNKKPQQDIQPGIIGGVSTEKRPEGEEERLEEPKAPKVKKSKKHEKPSEPSSKHKSHENPEVFPPRSQPAAHLGTESRNVHEESSPKYVGYESPEIVASHPLNPEHETHTKHPEQHEAHTKYPEHVAHTKHPEKETHTKHTEEHEAHTKHPEKKIHTKYPEKQKAYTEPEAHSKYPEKEARHLEQGVPPIQSEKMSKQPIPLEGAYHSGVGTEGKQVYEAKPRPIQAVEKFEGEALLSEQEKSEDVTQLPKEGYQGQPLGKGMKEAVKVVTEVTEVEYAALKKSVVPGEAGTGKEKEKGQPGVYSKEVEGKNV